MKKMNMRKFLKNKGETLKLTTLGFTLVELLAVIVILAIVLIIAVPGVLSIINSTKQKGYESQLKMIKDAARTYITTEFDKISWNEGTTVVTLDMLKAKGYLEKKIVDPRNKMELICVNILVLKNRNNRISYDVDDSCNKEYSITPRVGSGMIPIVYNGTNWVKADTRNVNFSWFNYGNQQWANVATVTETTRIGYQNAEVGSIVKMEDINAMFVWIPRFKYKLWNVTGELPIENNINLLGDLTIDLKFETEVSTKSAGKENGDWLTHPAFTFGGEELSGFWVGKFDTGYNQGTDVSAYTRAGAEKNELDASKIIIKPGVNSWRSIQLVNMYKNAIGMRDSNVFGLTTVEDPHMMKNMEWGAMTYLTQSKYGKMGNPIYMGSERKIRLNNNNDYLTGCGADKQDASGVNTCNSYDSVNGVSSSTTGNITGVYDTSGGSWDYVMAVMKTYDGLDLSVSSSGFSQDELNKLGADLKYIDVYEYGSAMEDRSRGHLGDATIEMGPFKDNRSTWALDYAHFVYPVGPWLLRGGALIDDVYGIGNTSFAPFIGTSRDADGSRIVIR